MFGPESFENDKRSKGIEADELPVEEVEMQGTVEEQQAALKAREQLQKDLDNTETAELGEAEVIEMKGHAPSAEKAPEDSEEDDNEERKAA